MHLPVLRVSVVNKVLEFFLRLASHNTSGDHSERNLIGVVRGIGVDRVLELR